MGRHTEPTRLGVRQTVFLSLWKGEVLITNPRRSMHDLAGEVCERWRVSLTDLRGRSQAKVHVQPRDEFIYMAYEQGNLSYTQIGRFLGRDHSSCVVARRRHLERLNA